MSDKLPPSELMTVPRTVKPRKRSYPVRSVIAIQGNETLSEDYEVGTVEDLIENLPTMPPTLFTHPSAADFVASLNERFQISHPEKWQWRVTSLERDILRPDGFKVASRISTVVHYFGWKGGNYHKIIDPTTMYGHRLDKIWPGEEAAIVRLLRWAVAVRNFCVENDIDVRPTTGSLAAQFLRDKRFYPIPRRKVPSAINERVREQLPGNHYTLVVHPSPNREYSAYYIDQHRAHHYHARTVSLPHADHLYAFGRFLDLEEVAFSKPVPNFYGLYCLDLQAPRNPSFMWGMELEKAFVYSNEIQHLLDLGYKINGVRAAWGSVKRDEGISKYAVWAESQLDRYGDPRWLKQILLSTYGVLAIKPTTGDSIFRLARAGELVSVRTGRHTLSGILTRRSRKLEPDIANVLHRAMIEAGTRSESVGLAQWLDSRGHRVLSIYADAVIVEADDDNPLPQLPEPWRLKETLNHLQFINQQAFISGEMTKLPGVNRELMKYRQPVRGRAPYRNDLYDALTGDKLEHKRKI